MNNRLPTGGEERLCSVWERCCFAGARFSLDGDSGSATVLSLGHRNVHAGPDYLDAVVLFSDGPRVGDVELHVGEAEWFAHGHHDDVRYAHVVLHVVQRRSPSRRTGLPTVVVRIEEEFRRPVPQVIDTADGLDHTLSTLAWERMMRRLGEASSRCQRGGRTAVVRWMIERIASIVGYGPNREAMQTWIARLFDGDAALPALTKGGFAARAVSMCGYPLAWLQRDLDGESGPDPGSLPGQNVGEFPVWSRSTRPAAAPGRRIAAVARLAASLLEGDGFRSVVEQLIRDGVGPAADAVSRLAGGSSLLGNERALTLLFDVWIPAATACAIGGRELVLATELLTLWRDFPSLGSNAVLRAFERRHMGTRRMRGAFWQAGAMEYQRLYGQASRSRELGKIREPASRYRRGPHAPANPAGALIR